MKIHISDTPQEAARVVTHQLLKQMDTVRKDSFSLAISGGYSAELLFRLWAEMYYKSLPWYRIHLYWVDERCVFPTDGDSNYGLAKKLFLDKVKIPHMQIHRIMGEANPQHEAQRYSELVKKNLPDNDGYPQFDMLILGMGTDGHTSSVFPGQNDLLTSPQPYAASINPYNGQRRIALTGQPMLRAGLTSFYVIGSEKAEILAQVLNPNTEAEKYPAGYIARHADHIEFFTDEAAAGKLGNTLK
ncbi:6-phosphogluconolactonase [Culturomica massiliensis]|jgi:6-phosphogluconolactonase|uniref:6-phosphogluconolactonase n=1 Tax=Culturomica massiliensis TaxID=1841857 RepID=UPI000E55B944|nr:MULTISPECIES: 6-phosphogluconolactonase [Odoribacteraceae]RHV93658.1 6-phosphogluconolactonase [Odoribacter sp. OF09-27XD]